MKKIYLSFCSIALATISFSQVKVNKTSALRAKATQSVKVGGTKEIKTPILYNKAIIWENSFGNPADWTLTNASTPAQDWTFSSDPAIVDFSSLAASGYLFASTSVADGFAVIDSDAAGETGSQDATITLAAPIDLSANPAVILSFEQISVRFRETTTVRVSGDNGVTWTSYEVNGSQEENTVTSNPELIEINISAIAGGQSQVLIEFNYVGAWDFGWAIDDVKISEALGNELVMSKTFTHDIVNEYDYSIVPATQIQPLTVGAIVYNLGGTTATALPMSVVINDGTTDVYSAPTNFDLAIGVTDTIWVATGFTPVPNKTYTVTFISPADDNLSNNTSVPASFSTSTNVYAQDIDNGVFRFDRDEETSMGNIFQIFTSTDLPAAAVKFATGTTATTCKILVSRFNPDDATYASVQSMEYIDEKDFSIPASAINSGNFTTIPFNSPIALEAGWFYVVQCLKAAGSDRIFLSGSSQGDDDGSTVCYGPFGVGNTVNNFIGWGFSPAVRMSFAAVAPAPIVTSSDADNILCPNGTLTLTSNVVGGNTWSNGATTDAITVTAAGVYTVTNSGSTSTSTIVTVQVISTAITVNFGTLSVPAQTGATYQWGTCAPVGPIAGANANSYVAPANGDYSIAVTIAGCTAVSIPCATVTAADLNENSAYASFSVFPNPANENIAIDFSLKAESNVAVSITDLSGKVVYTSNLGNKSIGVNSLNVNTTAFANGIYVVNVITENGIATEKLVIRK